MQKKYKITSPHNKICSGIFSSPLSCHAKSITCLPLLLDTVSQCIVMPENVYLHMPILVEVSLTNGLVASTSYQILIHILIHVGPNLL
jgi:hypothetical protein